MKKLKSGLYMIPVAGVFVSRCWNREYYEFPVLGLNSRLKWYGNEGLIRHE